MKVARRSFVRDKEKLRRASSQVVACGVAAIIPDASQKLLVTTKTRWHVLGRLIGIEGTTGMQNKSTLGGTDGGREREGEGERAREKERRMVTNRAFTT